MKVQGETRGDVHEDPLNNQLSAAPDEPDQGNVSLLQLSPSLPFPLAYFIK